MKVGQVVECRISNKNGHSIEAFKITKIGRKYVYLVSTHGNDTWQAEKVLLKNPGLFGPPPIITRCN